MLTLREVGGKKAYFSFGRKFSPQVENRGFRAMRWIFCCDRSHELKTKVGKFQDGWRWGKEGALENGVRLEGGLGR